MAVKFKSGEQKQMNEWLGGNKRYRCIFKATRDGCDSATFHMKCDNKGPTVTIMYNTSHSVYGGYTSLSWGSTKGYRNDGSAFIFRFYQNGNWRPIKLPIKITSYSIYDTKARGPTFGGGHDLPSFTNTIISKDDYFQFNTTFDFGHSYNTNGESSDSFTNGHMQIKDMEVYLIEGKTYHLHIDRKDAMEDWNKTLLNMNEK